MDIRRRIRYFLRSRRNSFECHWKTAERHHHYTNQELLCEQIGKSLCQSYEAGGLKLDVILSDIIEFASLNKNNADRKHMSWLSLHLGLGICYKFEIEDRQVVRDLLLELLKHRHGIDCGIFMNELIKMPNDVAYDDLPPKAIYFLKMCAGFKVDLMSTHPEERILAGPSRAHFSSLLTKGWSFYLDLPVVSSSLDFSYFSSLSNDGEDDESPLMIACKQLKPKVVLLLLQYGASPINRPIQYLLTTLGSVNFFPSLLTSLLFQRSLEPLKECLAYCLRATRQLKVSFGRETIRDTEESEVYFVREEAVSHIPKHIWSSPSSLQHLCRFSIWQELLSADRVPVPTNVLSIPDNLKAYLVYTS